MLECSKLDGATFLATIVDGSTIPEEKEITVTSTIISPQVIPAGTWVVDPVHTTIGFQVTDTSDLFSSINGRFTQFEGRLQGGEQPSLAGAIQVESLRTDN